MKKVKYTWILLVFSLFSCYQDIDQINIEGTITDHLTEKPIENVEVSIICWRYGNTPDGSYTEHDSITVITNNEGKYRCYFKKGAFIEVKTTILGYINQHVSTDLTSKNTTIDLKLKTRNNVQ